MPLTIDCRRRIAFDSRTPLRPALGSQLTIDCRRRIAFDRAARVSRPSSRHSDNRLSSSNRFRPSRDSTRGALRNTSDNRLSSSNRFRPENGQRQTVDEIPDNRLSSSNRFRRHGARAGTLHSEGFDNRLSSSNRFRPRDRSNREPPDWCA